MVSFSEIYLGIYMLRPMQYIELLLLSRGWQRTCEKPFLETLWALGAF